MGCIYRSTGYSLSERFSASRSIYHEASVSVSVETRPVHDLKENPVLLHLSRNTTTNEKRGYLCFLPKENDSPFPWEIIF